MAAGCATPDPAVHGDAEPPVRDGPAALATPVEWDRELPADVQIQDLAHEEGEARGYIPVRVVDDGTGEPVEGARIDGWWEAEAPGVDAWEALHEGPWTTDRDGFALVPTTDRSPWRFVEAEGYGPDARMGLDGEFRLTRGVDVTVEVRDWLDRPVPGAIVEALPGCHHVPAVRTETADADGRLTFRCIDGSGATELWIRAEGLAGRCDAHGYGWVERLAGPDGVVVLRGRPGPVLEGRILRADGSPAAGVRVGSRDAHHGPWAVTDGAGRYRIVGVRPHDHLIVLASAEDPVPEDEPRSEPVFQTAPGVFRTLRLPARDAVEPPAAEEDGLRISVRAGAGGDGMGRARVVAVGAEDGEVVVTGLQLVEGTAVRDVDAAPGVWRVTVGDPAGAFRPVTKEVDFHGGRRELRFDLLPNPTWIPRVAEPSADGGGPRLLDPAAGTIRVATDDGIVDATPHRDGKGAADGAIFVPAAGPFAVEFIAEDGRIARAVFDGPPVGEGPVLVLPPRRPETGVPRPRVTAGPAPRATGHGRGGVTVRAVDEAGEPLEEFVVTLGGWDGVDAEDGRVRIPDVGPGALRFWVAAPGRPLHDLRVVLGDDGEQREVVVRMRATAGPTAR